MEKINLEYWPIEKLVSYQRELRKNTSCIDRMVDSLNTYGFRKPIFAKRDGEIIDGDLRVKAARKLGYVEIPVLPVDGLSEMK